MRAGFGIDQLDVDPDLIAGSLDAPFENIANAQFAADLLGVDRLALVGESGVAGDHDAALDACDVGRQILGDAVREILLLRIVAEIGERQHDHRQSRRGIRLNRSARRFRLERPWLGMLAGPQPPRGTRRRYQRQHGGSEQGGSDCRPSAAGGGWRPSARRSAHSEGAHRLGNVLDPLLAQSGQPDGQPRADLVAHRTRKANPARLGERLQPGGDIDAIAEQVLSLDDDVSEMDADAEPHLLAGRTILVFLFNGALDRDSAFDRIDRAPKIGDDAVAGSIEDAAAMDGDQSVEYHPVGLQPAQRADLVQPHQPAVLGDVGREDRGELSFDHLVFCHRPSSRGADAATESFDTRIYHLFPLCSMAASWSPRSLSRRLRVIPAKAGIQSSRFERPSWTPAFAGAACKALDNAHVISVVLKDGLRRFVL